MAEKQGGGSDNEDKTEEPSQQRLEDFRKEGQVAQAKEFTSLMVLLAGGAALWGMGPSFIEGLFSTVRKIFTEMGTLQLTQENAGKVLMLALSASASIVLPIALAGFAAGIIGSIIQVGINFTWTPVQPQVDRIDPIKGFFRLLSVQSLVEGLKSLLKLIGVTWVAYLLIEKEIWTSPMTTDMEGWQIGSYFTSTGFKLVGSISVALFVIAALDFAYQKYRYHKSLMMSKQEVKEEAKQREGDPLLKARIRSMQKEAARKRMMQDIPKADVIVTNPTHIAVAIKYDAEKMAAPRVVAKGADLIAQRIKQVAKENGVPLVENVPLARALHKTVKVGGVVPRSLYQAVAEVLAYVYRLKGKLNL